MAAIRIKIIGLTLYWGAMMAAGCIYGVGAALLVVLGASCAMMVLAADEQCEGREDEKKRDAP